MTLVSRKLTGQPVDELSLVEVLTESKRTEHHPQRVVAAVQDARRRMNLATYADVVESVWDRDLITVEQAERALHYLAAPCLTGLRA